MICLILLGAVEAVLSSLAGKICFILSIHCPFAGRFAICCLTRSWRGAFAALAFPELSGTELEVPGLGLRVWDLGFRASVARKAWKASCCCRQHVTARQRRLDDCKPWRGPFFAHAVRLKPSRGFSPGDTTGPRLPPRRWPPGCSAFVPGTATTCILVEWLCRQTEGCQSFASDAAFVTFRDRRHAEFARGLRYSESLPAAVNTCRRVSSADVKRASRSVPGFPARDGCVGPGRGHFAVSLAPEPFDVHFASFTRSSASVAKGSALIGRLLVPWLISV